MTKHRVLFDTETKYLHITTADCWDSHVVELFSVESGNDNTSTKIGYTICCTFCLGYLQGNTREKSKNLPSDFELKYQG